MWPLTRLLLHHFLKALTVTCTVLTPVASFTKEVNPWLAKRPLKTNERLANLGLTSLVKEAAGKLPAVMAVQRDCERV